jgi:hypothetical protein
MNLAHPLPLEMAIGAKVDALLTSHRVYRLGTPRSAMARPEMMNG